MRKIHFKALLLISCLAPTTLYADSAKQTQALVVAEVNDTKITKADLDKELSRQLPAALESFEEAQQHAIKKTLLSKMIDRELLIQAAKKAGTTPSKDEVEKQSQQVRAQFNDKLEFQKLLTEKGETEQSFTQALAADMAIANYLKEKVFSKLSVSDEEAKLIFDSAPEQFRAPEQVRARHILFRLPPDADDATTNEVKMRAEDVLAQALKEDAHFEALAKQYSEEPLREKGGELGYFTKNQMVPAFSEAAFSLEKGAVSELVRTEFGFHIIKVEDKKPSEAPNFEKVKEAIKEQMLAEQQRKKLTEHLASAKKGAKVIVHMN